ncbi:indole-3-glycerol phosphate synthase TrpC [Dichelobacter nodosus]|uniref:indole-3-glycerol phosphate synthase TrpC n=1 Tax=Dichelobacter nodosus TaxID=870 RepID=UPI000E294C57|nr:indole-3-glycerol phosphate synthase TrpC [Dichelobacter nodosus]AXM45459.1 indole-3-glycerol phosphate synthase TrpC [Dichelobacter nodosus]
MTKILDDIVAYKQQEIAALKQQKTEASLIAELETLTDAPRGFMRALRDCRDRGGVAVVAEIKRASPNQGLLREQFMPELLAQECVQYGASCLSVFTDTHFFYGDVAYLSAVKKAVPVPVLRKDFIISRYQILESRLLGVDCILLIVAILTDEQLQEFVVLAHDLGMDVLIEIHDENDLKRALNVPVRTLAINNRNPEDFNASLEKSAQLRQQLPKDYFVISESGINTHADVVYLLNCGLDAVLIGGALMSAESAGEALHHLIYGKED